MTDMTRLNEILGHNKDSRISITHRGTQYSNFCMVCHHLFTDERPCWSDLSQILYPDPHKGDPLYNEGTCIQCAVEQEDAEAIRWMETNKPPTLTELFDEYLYATHHLRELRLNEHRWRVLADIDSIAEPLYKEVARAATTQDLVVFDIRQKFKKRLKETEPESDDEPYGECDNCRGPFTEAEVEAGEVGRGNYSGGDYYGHLPGFGCQKTRR